MRRDERMTVQGPVKEQQPDGMSHRGGQQRLAVTVRTANSFLLTANRPSVQRNCATSNSEAGVVSGVRKRSAEGAQRAHHTTSSTAPAHQRLGSANAETTPAGAPAAAADRTQRPDATCEGKNG